VFSKVVFLNRSQRPSSDALWRDRAALRRQGSSSIGIRVPVQIQLCDNVVSIGVVFTWQLMSFCFKMCAHPGDLFSVSNSWAEKHDLMAATFTLTTFCLPCSTNIGHCKAAFWAHFCHSIESQNLGWSSESILAWQILLDRSWESLIVLWRILAEYNVDPSPFGSLPDSNGEE